MQGRARILWAAAYAQDSDLQRLWWKMMGMRMKHFPVMSNRTPMGKEKSQRDQNIWMEEEARQRSKKRHPARKKKSRVGYAMGNFQMASPLKEQNEYGFRKKRRPVGTDFG